MTQATQTPQQHPEIPRYRSPKNPLGLAAHEQGDGSAVSTARARDHAGEDEIIRMAQRLRRGDWGAVNHQPDIDHNEHASRQQEEPVLGIYTARDGTPLYAVQLRRGDTPTVMHPEERRAYRHRSHR